MPRAFLVKTKQQQQQQQRYDITERRTSDDVSDDVTASRHTPQPAVLDCSPPERQLDSVGQYASCRIEQFVVVLDRDALWRDVSQR